jgi:hypothetical protein
MPPPAYGSAPNARPIPYGAVMIPADRTLIHIAMHGFDEAVAQRDDPLPRI